MKEKLIELFNKYSCPQDAYCDDCGQTTISNDCIRQSDYEILIDLIIEEFKQEKNEND